MTTPESAALGRLLLESRDTVTHLLGSLTGEPLVADVVRQTSQPVGTGDLLDVTVEELVLERVALLRGRDSAIPYVYAESIYPPGRLPAPVRRQLARTTAPIGRVLADHGLRQQREDLSPPQETAPPPLDTVAGASGVLAWWRSYRLVVNDVPVFVIKEWFFQSVLEAMARHGHS